MGKERVGFSLQMRPLSMKQKAVVLPAMVVVGGAAVGLAVWSVVTTPLFNDGVQKAVAANGFTVYVEKNTDLGVGKIVSKDSVSNVLGGKAKSVNSPAVSSVFNYNGDRSQTSTFNFVRSDNQNASVYVDMTQYKDQAAMSAQHILATTAKAPSINSKNAYYMYAQTLGTVREYRLLVVDGLKAYKFVMDQPYRNITINEVAALSSLIKIANKAQF
jgi:hypothetical protein